MFIDRREIFSLPLETASYFIGMALAFPSRNRFITLGYNLMCSLDIEVRAPNVKLFNLRKMFNSRIGKTYKHDFPS